MGRRVHAVGAGVNAQRLRNRPLTVDSKPRVIRSTSDGFWVEKMTTHGPIVEKRTEFQDAINLACWWAVIRKEEAK